MALEFPRLTSTECTSDPPSDTCYESHNDIGDLDVESLRIDDGDEYELTGDEITLGAGGLAASPAAGASGVAGDIFKLPIQLDASQTWSVAERSGEPALRNGAVLEGNVTGATDNLKVDLSNEPVVYFGDKVEVGRLAIEGVDPGEVGGLVHLEGAALNAGGGPVELSHTIMLGPGALGELSTDDAGLVVGQPEYPTGGVGVASATFDAGSAVDFVISGGGTAAGLDYSQLSSTGAVALGGASLGVRVAPMSGKSCPSLTSGQRYVLLSTTGSLSGSFGDAPEGSEIPVTYSESCAVHSSGYLRITYDRSGSIQSVIGTVPGANEVPEPENTYNPYVRAEASVEWGAISGAIAGAEYQAKQHAAEAAAKELQAREEAERKAREAQQDAASMLASPLASNITVQRDGAALVGLECSGSATGQSCAGKLALSVQARPKSGKRSRTVTVTVTIATSQFSVGAGKTATVHVDLNRVGRALLRADHDSLSAHLTVLQSAPTAHTQMRSVRLVQEKAIKGRKP